jgi:hypothetical protein
MSLSNKEGYDAVLTREELMRKDNVYNMSDYRYKYTVKSYHKTVKEKREKQPDWLKIQKQKALERTKNNTRSY